MQNMSYIKITLFGLSAGMFILSGYYFISAELTGDYNATNQSLGQKAEKVTWNAYNDKKSGFKLEYPSQSDVSTIYKEKMVTSRSGKEYYIIDGGVSFSKGGKGFISVMVFENTKYLSLDSWLKDENKKFEGQHSVIEKRISIGGQDAIVTYPVGDNPPNEEYKSDKKTAFFKNGNLYVIYTSITDHERVWNSFKFNK